MNALKPWHLVVLAVVFLVLFGAKRLPDSARSLGRSLRIFKSEVQELNKDDSDGDKKTTAKTTRCQGLSAFIPKYYPRLVSLPGMRLEERSPTQIPLGLIMMAKSP